ncbi:hypothetical protein BJ742DRAFT_855369 [Cladochytrium replicatum]|nr:hypothetical protein BJ742DRAFT_855369 [Cladochytrium replicatum]
MLDLGVTFVDTADVSDPNPRAESECNVVSVEVQLETVTPGRKKIIELEENVQALNVKFNDEEISKIPAVGDCYPAVLMSSISG